MLANCCTVWIVALSLALALALAVVVFAHPTTECGRLRMCQPMHMCMCMAKNYWTFALRVEWRHARKTFYSLSYHPRAHTYTGPLPLSRHVHIHICLLA